MIAATPRAATAHSVPVRAANVVVSSVFMGRLLSRREPNLGEGADEGFFRHLRRIEVDGSRADLDLLHSDAREGREGAGDFPDARPAAHPVDLKLELLHVLLLFIYPLWVSTLGV